MHVPHLPLSAWWAITIAALATDLAFWLPLMPSATSKWKRGTGTAAPAACVAALLLLTGGTLEETLPVLAIWFVTPSLMFAGHRKVMRQLWLDHERPEAVQEDRKVPVLIWVQAAVVLAVMACPAGWLVWHIG
ncbi:hypothetical protein [Streptomyces aureoversilis]|uniref:DUF456 domain-containing protein n=1 Tax=Streptomyces aureoversilis TaxID=67277 RepID=A0ABV9ZSS3_9ACTN